jgi:putative glutamine amidotransferase
MPPPLVGIVCDLKSHNDGSHSHRAGDEYVRALRDGAGAGALLIPASDPPPDVALLERLDGLLFPGAPSNVASRRYGGAALAPGTALDEARDATGLALIAAAIARGLPVFCICRGFQELNVVLGGSLNPEVAAGGLDHREDADAPLDRQYAPAHAITIEPGGLLAGLLGVQEVMVNSLHAQGIARLAPGLRVEARAPDGLIEAVSLPSAKGFVLGVQWHPEWHAASDPASGDPVSLALFSAFGRAVDSRRLNYGKNGPDKRKMI